MRHAPARGAAQAGKLTEFFNIAVIQKVGEFLRRHDRAVVFRLFRRRAEMRKHGYAVHVEKFGRRKIGDIRVYLARFDCGYDIGMTHSSPRDRLTMFTPSFILAIVAAFTSPRVPSVSGTCNVM